MIASRVLLATRAFGSGCCQLLRPTANLGQCRQVFDRCGLVVNLKTRVRVHREVDVTVTCKRLCKLGRYAGSRQVCDESLAECMEIGVSPIGIHVG